MKKLPDREKEKLCCVLREWTAENVSREKEETFHPADDMVFLEEFMAGALAEETLAEYRVHLTKCPDCRGKMAFYAKVGLLPSLPQESVRSPLVHKARSPILFRAVCGVAASLAVILTLIFSTETVPPKSLPATNLLQNDPWPWHV